METPILPMDRDSIAGAAAAVRRGGVVVYPTDTVYGVGCDPFDPAAVERLFRAKGREGKPVPVLCSSEEKAGELVELNDAARGLARRHWPGALTIVAPLKREVPRLLSQGGDTLGVRVPDHAGCLELIAACGGWLTGTSANRSGAPASRTAAEALAALGGEVDIILDGGVSNGAASTVVRVEKEGVTILRTGPIGVRDDEMRGR